MAEAAVIEIQAATKGYLEGKAFLLAALQTSAAIKEKIALASNQWAFVEASIGSSKPPTPTNYSDVWAASENTLSVMDEICGAYFKLS